MAIKTEMSTTKFKEVENASFTIFKNVPTGTGDPEMPDGMWARGSLQAWEDMHEEGSYKALSFILHTLKKWYKTPEVYQQKFLEQNISPEDLKKYTKTVAGMDNVFESQSKINTESAVSREDFNNERKLNQQRDQEMIQKEKEQFHQQETSAIPVTHSRENENPEETLADHHSSEESAN